MMDGGRRGGEERERVLKSSREARHEQKNGANEVDDV